MRTLVAVTVALLAIFMYELGVWQGANQTTRTCAVVANGIVCWHGEIHPEQAVR